MSTAKINTAMLSWARLRSGIAAPDFAKKCGVNEERLLEWEQGTHPLTFNQAIRFAAAAHIPFGYLFLSHPPLEYLPIPDLRTLDGQGVPQPSAELQDLLKLMQQRQEWFREYMQQHFAEANKVVGCLSSKDGVEVVVADMRHKLGVGLHPNRGRWDQYYRDLVEKIESLGILVMRQSHIGHFTRPLRIEEFRGFAMVDEFAPIIFINHADAPGARLFTLIHELCHIWIGQSGISDSHPNTQRQEEVFCNAVAAEFLVPAAEFTQRWDAGLTDWTANLPVLEAHFRVSTWVLARRALTLSYISEQQYRQFVAILQKSYKEKKDKEPGAPSFYKTKKAQISGLFSRAVVSEALSGQLLLREASQLLDGIKPAKMAHFAGVLGI